jgi:hypothetical protein
VRSSKGNTKGSGKESKGMSPGMRSQIGFGQRALIQMEGTGNKTVVSWIGKKHSPERMVLLNHMMKPMTYSSVQY